MPTKTKFEEFKKKVRSTATPLKVCLNTTDREFNPKDEKIKIPL